MSAKRKKKLPEIILGLPVVSTLVEWSKEHSLPGFYGIPLYDVFVFLIRESQKHDLILRANSMAFSFFLSIFPSIMVLFTLVAYFPIFENYSNPLRMEIFRMMPNEAGSDLFARIENIATKQRGGLLSLSFLLAFYFSSNGMRVMLRSFQKDYERTFRKRTSLQRHLVSFKLLFLMAGLLLTSTAVIILGNRILNTIFSYVQMDILSKIGLFALRLISILLVVYVGISFIYRWGAATHKKFKLFSPGATLATCMSLIASFGFSFYVDNFGQYNELYGPIGAIIVLMLWIQINCFSLLVGYELNASIAVNRDLREDDG